ncbi:hypothetical protein L1049_007074 [Liquidambar formosana]|uniref:Uncharacterized protein n=1 Tax=Liquidambar formosana TaxID=63359 RepID=A0AAP0RGL1_LIQFO
MDSSSSSMSSPSASPLHLALAAIVGASFMAISAFYIHRRSVDQVLQRLIEIRRKSPSNHDDRRFDSEDYNDEEVLEEDQDEEGYSSDGEVTEQKMWRQSLPRSFNENTLRAYRVSSSLPNAFLSNRWVDEEAKFDPPRRFGPQAFSSSLDKLNLIPSGLPPLRTAQRDEEDQPLDHSGSNTRVASVGRLTTPRSAGVNAFESAGDSDEEGTEFANEEDILFGYGNIDSSASFIIDVNPNVQNPSVVPFGVDGGNCAEDQKYRVPVSDTKANVDLQRNGNLDATSVPFVGNDSIFSNATVPQRPIMHGIFNFLALRVSLGIFLWFSLLPKIFSCHTSDVDVFLLLYIFSNFPHFLCKIVKG